MSTSDVCSSWASSMSSAAPWQHIPSSFWIKEFGRRASATPSPTITSPSAGVDESPRRVSSEAPWQDVPAVVWMKEFGSSATPASPLTSSGSASAPPSIRERVSAIVRDYLDNAYVSGVYLAARRNTNFVDRWFWIAVVLAALAGSVREIVKTYSGLYETPTTVEVRDMARPMQHFPYPALAVCPRMKIRRREALKYLMEANNVSYINETLVMPALESLQGFRVPYWLDEHFAPLHPDAASLFAGLDLRHFMERVSLDCKTVFLACMWAGRRVDCCAMFKPIMSNAGKCFIFNSHASRETAELCPPIPLTQRKRASLPVIWYNQRSNDLPCRLVRASDSGPYSAAEIFMKISDPEDMLTGAETSSGYAVSVLAANDHVDVNRGSFVSEESDKMTAVSVSYHETLIDTWTMSLLPEHRKCLFEDEVPAALRSEGLTWYTPESCIYVCRLAHLAERCGCHSYLSAAMENQCSLEMYKCFVEHSKSLFWVRTPSSHEPSVTQSERNHSLWPDCRACLPACALSVYEAKFETQRSLFVPRHGGGAFLNVFFRDPTSAIKYVENRRMTTAEQFAAYWMAFNLLLGLSVMSAAQLVFYAVQLAAVLCGRLRGGPTWLGTLRGPRPGPHGRPEKSPSPSTRRSSLASSSAESPPPTSNTLPLPFVH